MKFIKLLVFVFSIFLVSQASAQEVKKQTKKKFGWMDKDKNGSISLEELKAFHKGKKDKKGNPLKTELMFLGYDANDDHKISLVELDGKLNWKRAKQKMKAKNN